MAKYDFKRIERKWQKRWLEEKVFRAKEGSKRRKYYQLETFPYPSAAGLHVGHPKGYIAEDIHARYMRMRGKEVLYTMGWDAFGLPTENYAIKVGKSPQEVAEANVKNFKRQVQMLGFSYDWDREINTSSPEYYKWTQWLFLKLWEKGLAYRKKAVVNWCPKDQTVLANEQVSGGCCERCESPIEQKEMEQWFFRITDYAERLLSELNGLDWPGASIKRQKDWIGKSEGAEIEFPIFNFQFPKEANFVLLHAFRGSSQESFLPWLKKEIESCGGSVFAPDLPNPSEPNIEEQVEFLMKNHKLNENTTIITHSLGGPLAMKLLPKLKTKISDLIMVAPPSRVEFLDGKPRPALEEACDWKFNFGAIKEKISGRIVVMRDLNDPIVPPDQPKEIAEGLGIELTEVEAKEGHFNSNEEPTILSEIVPAIRVFTTRPDTLFGATYMVLAPEHPLIANNKERIANWNEVQKYIEQAKHKTELQRQEETKEKTGVELKGIKAVNPATKEEIPIWVADYVLMGYGTGAIMAVPAHDERDYEFAKKFGLQVREVIVPNIVDRRNPPVEGKKTVERQNIHAIVRDPSTGKYLALKWKKFDWTTFPMGGVSEGEDIVAAAKREVKEETGFVNLKLVKVLDGRARAEYFAAHKDENRIAYTTAVIFELVDHERVEVDAKEKEAHDTVWLDKSKLNYENMTHAEVDLWSEKLNSPNAVYTGEGVLLDSGRFSGMNSEKAKWEITKFVGGRRKVQYRLRDWSVSRQRYWGCPIPIIYCRKCWEASSVKGQGSSLRYGIDYAVIEGKECAIVPVAEKELPVKLPPLKNYRPKGVPPLESSKEFIGIKCPQCGGEARRDPETLDTFVDSSWYFLRYVDPHNDEQFALRDKLNFWLPVDLYIIGAEHTTLHLLYARFITKFLHDIGCLNFAEPFLKLRHQGLILGEDGQKMSKSKGNVVNPDELINEFGADTVRLYEMFMGPFEQGQPWDSKGVLGAHRFLQRIWNYFSIWQDATKHHPEDIENSPDEKVNRFLHKTIKRVGEDIQSLKFNTAISSLMIFLNEIFKGAEKKSIPGLSERSYLMSVESKIITTRQFEQFVKVLHPFAPHLAQELWSRLGHDTYLDFEPWPEYNPEFIKEDKITLVVQVNGKVRDTLEAEIGIAEEEARRIALGSEKVQKYLGGKEPRKVVYVPNKLINIVI